MQDCLETVTILRGLLASCMANVTLLEDRLQDCQVLVEAALGDQDEVATGTLAGITSLLVLVGAIRLVVLHRDGNPPVFILDRYGFFLKILTSPSPFLCSLKWVTLFKFPLFTGGLWLCLVMCGGGCVAPFYATCPPRVEFKEPWLLGP